MSKVSPKAGGERVVESGEAYLDADGCATRYAFSRRHWFRLVDSGHAPRPTHFGRLVRWSLATLIEWEAGGCKSVRAAGKGGAR